MLRLFLFGFGCYFRLLWRWVLRILLALLPTWHQLLPKMLADLCHRHILHFVDWLQISSPGSILASMLLQLADIHHVVFLFFHTNLCMKTWDIIRQSWIYGYLWYMTEFFYHVEHLWTKTHDWNQGLTLWEPHKSLKTRTIILVALSVSFVPVSYFWYDTLSGLDCKTYDQNHVVDSNKQSTCLTKPDTHWMIFFGVNAMIYGMPLALILKSKRNRSLIDN